MPSSQRRTTIRDIAERAGVSIGTASNVLSDKGGHAEQTRQRVLRAAADLNYAPNALIRSLQSGRTNTIGVFTWRVAPGSSRSITMRLLEGITEGLAEARLDTLLYSRHPHEDDEVPAAFFMDGRVDGVIVAPGGLSQPEMEKLAGMRLAAVALYHEAAPAGIGSVTIDNRSGVVAAVRHLAGLGHRRIAFCSPDYTWDYRQRAQGYVAGLQTAGLPCDPALIVKLPIHREARVESGLQRLLRLPEPPTAIVAGDDGVALALLAALKAQGVDVPREVSLVGFDDSPSASDVSLTTVHQPAERIGRTAARFVRALLAGDPPGACRVNLPVRLVVRATTGAAPR